MVEYHLFERLQCYYSCMFFALNITIISFSSGHGTDRAFPVRVDESAEGEHQRRTRWVSFLWYFFTSDEASFLSCLRAWLQEAQLHPLLQVLQRRQRDETAQERLRSQGHSQPVQGLARQLAILNVMLQQSEREKIYFRYIFIRRSDSFNVETTE